MNIEQPARVKRGRAMELLNIEDPRIFKKVVDANPQMKHRLPGETRFKYLTSVITKLLEPRCATVVGRKEQKSEVRGQKSDRPAKKSARTL